MTVIFVRWVFSRATKCAPLALDPSNSRGTVGVCYRRVKFFDVLPRWATFDVLAETQRRCDRRGFPDLSTREKYVAPNRQMSLHRGRQHPSTWPRDTEAPFAMNMSAHTKPILTISYTVVVGGAHDVNKISSLHVKYSSVRGAPHTVFETNNCGLYVISSFVWFLPSCHTPPRSFVCRCTAGDCGCRSQRPVGRPAFVYGHGKHGSRFFSWKGDWGR